MLPPDFSLLVNVRVSDEFRRIDLELVKNGSVFLSKSFSYDDAEFAGRSFENREEVLTFLENDLQSFVEGDEND